jgi:thiol-disulfide isomerase/thioredoxin
MKLLLLLSFIIVILGAYFYFRTSDQGNKSEISATQIQTSSTTSQNITSPAATTTAVSQPSVPRSTSQVQEIPTATADIVTTTFPLVTAPSSTMTQMKSAKYQLAHELVSPDAYLNTEGKHITLAQYRGRNVVLLEFWTYSCINCEHTLPYLVSWYSKYVSQRLVIIGVHTPEFPYEHIQSNVEAALKQYGITYPVVLDNENQTWSAYGNRFWPHQYVIDVDGYITHDQIGEGGYDATEAAIQAALAERQERLPGV